jgi:hypothetical protein
MSFLIVASLIPVSARAGSLILKVEEIGYEDAADDGRKPVAKLLSSLQLAVHSDQPFSGRSEFAGRKIMVRGTWKPGKEPDVVDLQIRAAFHRDSGVFVTASDGVERPIVNKSEVKTQISVKVGEPTKIAGLVTAITSNGVSRNCESRIILRVSALEPDDEEGEDEPE